MTKMEPTYQDVELILMC